MSERLRSAFVRWREYVGNRRRAVRHEMRLPVRVSVKPEAIGERRASIAGFTQDISLHGVALVVGAIRVGTTYLTSEGTTLNLAIELPDGATLECAATPVRYHKLETANGGDINYLIGVRITETSDAGRQQIEKLTGSRKG
jgi:hypothetical protein